MIWIIIGRLAKIRFDNFGGPAQRGQNFFGSGYRPPSGRADQNAGRHIFSLEMSKEQLVDRLLCAQANVELWKMRTGKLSDREEDNDFSRIGHAMGVLSEAPIYIDDSATSNVMEIRTKARRLQMEKGLGLMVIDYLQLMEGRVTY